MAERRFPTPVLRAVAGDESSFVKSEETERSIRDMLGNCLSDTDLSFGIKRAVRISRRATPLSGPRDALGRLLTFGDFSGTDKNVLLPCLI